MRFRLTPRSITEKEKEDPIITDNDQA